MHQQKSNNHLLRGFKGAVDPIVGHQAAISQLRMVFGQFVNQRSWFTDGNGSQHISAGFEMAIYGPNI